MQKKQRKYCYHCSGTVDLKMEDDTLREYCPACRVYFYENPLPVVSSILVKNQHVLLVERGNEPFKGQWCLPSGFVETGETVAEAALRELEEETGVTGEIVQLLDVDSCSNYYYGDLLFLTFEVEHKAGEPRAGDDAVAVRYFPLEQVPDLAFPSNIKALQAYIKDKPDYWAIVDSFRIASGGERLETRKENLLSNELVALIERHSGQIAELWMEDVRANKSTPTYHDFDRRKLHQRVFLVLSHFRQWLSGSYCGQDIISWYFGLGRQRNKEGFLLSEVISALSLIKKHIWEFALSRGVWSKTIDMYMILELERRISLFFDKAMFHVAKGFEEDPESR